MTTDELPFLPSHVLLRDGNPFMNTFGHSETEVAAGMLVRYLAANGDTWEPVLLSNLPIRPDGDVSLLDAIRETSWIKISDDERAIWLGPDAIEQLRLKWRDPLSKWASFPPSSIRLVGAVPLGDTFGKLEREAFAAMLVFALARGGDTWRAITRHEVADQIGKLADSDSRELEELTIKRMLLNPFVRILPDRDASQLADLGALTVTDDGSAYSFTRHGIALMRKWVHVAR